MALAQQCALALERARLYEAEQQARQAAEQATERQRQLSDMVAAFLRSMTREQVAQVFVERGLAMLSATAGSVAVMAGEGELEIVHAAGYPPAVHNRWTRFRLTEPVPLAEAVRTGRAIWMHSAQELAQHYPGLVGVPQQTGHTAMACLPLVAGGRTLGALGLSFIQAEALSPEQHELALTLAEECAQALDRAQAYSALQDSVRERSRELEAANARLQGEVQEREQTQAQLAASYEQLRELASDLQQAREEERRRLSRELHDVLGGALTGLKLTVARMRRHTAGSAEASGTLDQALSQMDEAIGLVRRLATDLRPAALDDLGLLAALEWLVQDFGDRSGLDCRLETELAKLELDPETAIGVYRVVQESLTNVARHAQATAVRVSLAQEADCVVLRVADDGRGFELGAPAKAHSLGLAGMRERVYAFAGELEITSARGTGTTVTVRIPSRT